MPRVIRVNGLRVVEEPATRAGPPPRPVVLVHGMFGGAWCFEGFQHVLAAHGIPSYAVDLRGHHDSRPVEQLGRVTVADYVADVLDVVRELDRPAILGHSMGGLIAQKVAEAGAVSAAILLCPAPPFGITAIRPHLLVHLRGWALPMLADTPVRPDPAVIEALATNQTPLEYRNAIFERLVPESGRAARELTLGVRVDARRVACPVLAIAGAEDRLIAPSAVRQVARKFGATYWEIPRHAHFFFSEPGWDQVARSMVCWLEQAEAR